MPHVPAREVAARRRHSGGARDDDSQTIGSDDPQTRKLARFLGRLPFELAAAFTDFAKPRREDMTSPERPRSPHSRTACGTAGGRNADDGEIRSLRNVADTWPGMDSVNRFMLRIDRIDDRVRTRIEKVVQDGRPHASGPRGGSNHERFAGV